MPSTAGDDDEGIYKEVRGLSRGLAVLKALNRLPGGIGSTSELARLCALDRTTTKRLLETLRAQGFVRQGEKEGQYYLTFEVRRLSEGFEDEAWVARIASPAMQAAVRELVWPCDLGTAEAGFMVVRESTHRWSALSQHRAMIGEKMPLLETAIGRAYLAAADEAEREALLELLRRRGDRLGELARDGAFVQRLIAQTLERGYAINEGEWLQQADFAAVAVPVHAGQRLLAALNLVFPKAAVSERDLQERFVPALRRLGDAIGRGSRAWIE
ncbi:DNA-binding transcriptional regulator [Azohydromonas lata]|uniref:DNA-binding transcriptional regulator n=1 Tax=Azohydromonas lata TaxID=45677 RepID=A0ABU5IKT9_9BURK|nr:DNA-binding transcriptional regulator [Azohydromonas lata]MDZ5459499.1 DNA-binding transcriptional regulator [Azohydromonas lata]